MRGEENSTFKGYTSLAALVSGMRHFMTHLREFKRGRSGGAPEMLTTILNSPSPILVVSSPVLRALRGLRGAFFVSCQPVLPEEHMQRREFLAASAAAAVGLAVSGNARAAAG